MEVLISHGSYGCDVDRLQNSHKFRVGIRILYPYPGCCGAGVQNLQKLPVWDLE